MVVARNIVRSVLCAVVVFLITWSVAGAQQAGTRFIKGQVSMSAEERSWLQEHKNLRLGMWLGSPPLIFRGDDGTMEGMVPAYVNLVLKKLDLEPRLVRASGFGAMWELARAGEVDMVCAVTFEPERQKVMLLSEPYLFAPVVIATRPDFPFISGLSDLHGHKVAMISGTITHVRAQENYQDMEIIPFGEAEQGLLALSDGRVDAFVAAQPVIAYLSRELGIENIRVSAVTEYSYKLSIGVRKDWPVLQTMINRSLAAITEDERIAINDYWTVLRDSNWVQRPHVWRIVGIIVAIALSVLGLFMHWNRKLSNEVSERRKAEKKYRRAHEATQRIIESADVMIVGLDFTGHVRLFNRAAEAITGYSRAEVIGKNWFEIVVPKERFLYVWDEFIRLIRVGRGSTSETFENPILAKNGNTRHILWRNSVTDEGEDGIALIAFGTDITSRLRAEEELRLTQFAMDNAAVGIFHMQPSGNIVYVNRAAASLLGYTRSELRRLSIHDISPEFTRENWPVFWNQLKQNQMMTSEKQAMTRDGRLVEVEVTSYYLLFKGTELVIGFFLDIAERKRVERLREDVERMVRHDLRSPILAVQTLFKLFSRAENLTEEQFELLESVMQSSRRMVNILDMSRALYLMESGTYEVRSDRVELFALIASVIEDLKPLLRRRRVDIVMTYDGVAVQKDVTLFVKGEEMLCYALLTNLFKNAVEASDDGDGVQVDCSCNESVIISVHNTKAIPEAIRDSFFDKYVTHGKEDGTGLGTYTAWLVTRALKGKIDFTTSDTDGTVIIVELPSAN